MENQQNTELSNNKSINSISSLETSMQIPVLDYDTKSYNMTTYKERLEEAAEKYAESKSSKFSFRTTHIRDFTAGAKWQSEGIYSKEDMKSAWEDGRKFEYDHNGGEGGEFTGAESFEEWFEQFKKI